MDYKLAAKSLAIRLQKVLPFLINHDQQGYVKNRNISYNIRQINDIIDYCNILNHHGVILFLDLKT